MKEVLNGGYNVHPVPPPNSEIKERITKRYERKRNEREGHGGCQGNGPKVAKFLDR